MKQITFKPETLLLRGGIAVVIEAAQITGEQYIHMTNKALFDYSVMVGEREYVEKTVTVTEKERVAEL